MEFKLNIDTSSMEKQLKEDMTNKMRNAFQTRLRNFFDIHKTSGRDINDRSIIIEEKGDGIKEIDEMIANEFLNPKFQESMDKFFDHNWERIFEECMTRALQHKANGIAFNKMHDLPPMKELK